MALLTGLRYQNLIDREPALTNFEVDYLTSLQPRIDEAKTVIDNILRGEGYDLNKIGIRYNFFNFDNPAHASTVNSGAVTITDATRLLIVNCFQNIVSATITLTSASPAVTLFSETIPITAGQNYGFILGNYLPDSVTLTITEVGTPSPQTIAAGTIQAYLTDASLYFVHLYKSLQLIYESMTAEPGDLFEVKALRYREEFDNAMNTLVTYYDADGSGNTEIDEKVRINAIRATR